MLQCLSVHHALLFPGKEVSTIEQCNDSGMALFFLFSFFLARSENLSKIVRAIVASHDQSKAAIGPYPLWWAAELLRTKLCTHLRHLRLILLVLAASLDV